MGANGLEGVNNYCHKEYDWSVAKEFDYLK